MKYIRLHQTKQGKGNLECRNERSYLFTADRKGLLSKRIFEKKYEASEGGKTCSSFLEAKHLSAKALR